VVGKDNVKGMFPHSIPDIAMTTLRIASALFALALTAAAQVPQLLNYQGRVAVDSVNFDGAGLFKFALVDADGATTFWSNDDSSVAGSEPAVAVSLTVSKGLYSVLLGDVSLANMSAIPASVFTNPDVRLRVWFDDGVNGSQLLTPDQRLAPSPYLADGAVTTASIAAGAVTGASIAAGAINGTHVAPGSLDFSLLTVPIAPGAGQVLGFDGATLNWVDPGSVNGGVSGSGTTGRIPLWTSGTILGNSLITQSASGVQLPNGVQLAPGTNGNSVTFGSPNSETGMTMSGPTGRADVRFDGTTLRMLAGPAGFPPSIGVAVNTSGVQLPNGVQLGAGTNGYQVQFGSPNSEDGMTMSGASGRADLRYDGTLKLVNGAGGIPLATNGIAITNAGNVGIGTVTPGSKLDVSGDVTTTRLILRADPAATTNAAVLCGNAGVTTFVPFNTATGRPLNLTVSDANVRTLTIRGGADLAEPFAMTQGGVQAGTVVSIDPAHPGKLKKCTAAYDRKVAGIVSGANGVHPGISMIDEQQLEAGENVALSGRVYVKANASAGSIAPGDFLTTSGIPGEAMKAADAKRAQGSILGKAMTPLDESTGMVLVLVTLQ
jgi:hypothetical protein